MFYLTSLPTVRKIALFLIEIDILTVNCILSNKVFPTF